MAVLSKHACAGDWAYFKRENIKDVNWSELMDSDHAQFEELMKISESLKPGELVGLIMRFPVGDGNACYRVSKIKPFTLEWIPVSDAWSAHHALIKGLTVKDAIQQQKFELLWRKKKAA